MEARGYDPAAKRTRYRILKFSLIDLLSFIGGIIILVVVILFGVFSTPIESFIWSLF